MKQKLNLRELYQSSVYALYFQNDRKKAYEYYQKYKSLGGRKSWIDIKLTTEKWLKIIFQKYKNKGV